MHLISRILAVLLCVAATVLLLFGCGLPQSASDELAASEAVFTQAAEVSQEAMSGTETADVSSADEETSQEVGREEQTMTVTIGGSGFVAIPADTQAAREFVAILAEGPVSIQLSDYGGFEKVGPLGRSLTATNERITTGPGDIVLYNGDNIVLFYGNNTWEYTPIASVADLSGWQEALGSGDVEAVFSLD